jgi:hypothetical protein
MQAKQPMRRICADAPHGRFRPRASAVVTDTLNIGASAHNFFTASNGWEGFAANDQYLNCNGVITAITN